MSSVLNEEQGMLKDMATSFFTDHAPISLHRRLRDEQAADGFSRELWQQIVDMGWTGINIPEEFGGLDFGYRGLGIVMEEAGRTLAASPLLSTVVLGASAIVLGGSTEQKAQLLPKVVEGSLLLALAIDEGAHHNPAGIALTASKARDDYILNGSKQFVMDGHVADKLIVVARTSGQPGSVEGLSLFLIDADADGIINTKRSMADQRNASTIEFKDVKADAASIIGDINNSGKLLEQILDRGCVVLAAEMLGSMQQAFEMILDYLKERKQFGQAIGSFQALQHRAAVMFSDVEQCKSVVSEALCAIDEGRDGVAELASMAKAMVNHAYHNISCEGIQMHGGMGMTDESNIGFYLKRARVAEQCLGSANYHQSRYAALKGF